MFLLHALVNLGPDLLTCCARTNGLRHEKKYWLVFTNRKLGNRAWKDELYETEPLAYAFLGILFLRHKI